MSLDCLLGGTEHKCAMKRLKNELFYLAYIKQGINFMYAQEVYVKEFKRQEKRLLWKNHKKLPEWVVESKALQKLEAYVLPNYHITRYIK